MNPLFHTQKELFLSRLSELAQSGKCSIKCRECHFFTSPKSTLFHRCLLLDENLSIMADESSAQNYRELVITPDEAREKARKMVWEML